jgi:DNA-binding protein HU-beta
VFFVLFLFSGQIFLPKVTDLFTRGEIAATSRLKRKNRKEIEMAKVLTKSQIIQAIADAHKEKLARKDVARVIESLATVGYKELKKNGLFVLPGFAKFVVVKKPATKERPGINPFTKEPITIKAKPARKVLKARPLKAAKDSLA